MIIAIIFILVLVVSGVFVLTFGLYLLAFVIAACKKGQYGVALFFLVVLCLLAIPLMRACARDTERNRKIEEDRQRVPVVRSEGSSPSSGWVRSGYTTHQALPPR
jgi:hypothetical protein